MDENKTLTKDQMVLIEKELKNSYRKISMWRGIMELEQARATMLEQMLRTEVAGPKVMNAEYDWNRPRFKPNTIRPKIVWLLIDNPGQTFDEIRKNFPESTKGSVYTFLYDLEKVGWIRSEVGNWLLQPGAPTKYGKRYFPSDAIVLDTKDGSHASKFTVADEERVSVYYRNNFNSESTDEDA